MKEINQRLFSRLGGVAGKLVSKALLDVPRAIETNQVGKNWLKNAKVKKTPHLTLGPKAQFAIAAFDNRHFLVAVGVEIILPDVSDILPIELNSGAFTLFATELEVPFNELADIGHELAEHVFIPLNEESDKAVILPMDVVERYFEKISLFEIQADSSLISDDAKDYRIALAAVLCANTARPLAWSSRTMERLGEMAMDRNEKAPFHLLFRMLTESRGDAAFLDVYRCIEQLFPLPKIATFCDELGVTIPAMQVARSLEHHLGWRRPEIESLTQIMAGAPSSLLDQLREFFQIAVGTSDQAGAIAKAIYDLRNRHVHYRALHAADIEALPPDWLNLADLLLELVQFLYAENANAFKVSST